MAGLERRTGPRPRALVLSCLILVLAVVVPFTLPSRVSIGGLQGAYTQGAAPGWMVVGTSPSSGDTLAAFSREEGDRAAQRIEVPAGSWAWFLPHGGPGFGYRVGAECRVTLTIRYVFVPGPGGEAYAALATSFSSRTYAILNESRSLLPAVGSPTSAPVTLGIDKAPASLVPAIGVRGPGVLTVHSVGVEVVSPAGYEDASDVLTSTVWGIDVSPPFGNLVAWSLLSAPGMGARASAILACWLLCLALAMVGLARLDFRLATVTLMASLAVGAIEPSPFEVLWLAWGAVGLWRGEFAEPAEGGFREPARLWAVGLSLALLAAMATSWIIGGGGRSPLLYVVTTAYLVTVGLSFAAYTFSEERLEHMFVGLVAATAIGILASLAAALLPGSLLGGEATPIHGLMKDKNVFGPLAVMGLLALWALWEKARPGTWLGRPRVFEAAAAAATVAVVLSRSRAAWGSLAVAGVFAFLASRPEGRRRLAVAAAVGVGVVGCALLASPALVSQIADGLRVLQTYDIDDRFPMQGQALAIGLEHPLGAGPLYMERTLGMSVHSIYIRLFAENGWLALAAFAGLLALAMVCLWRLRRRPAASAVLISLVIIALNGIVIDVLHWRSLWVLLGAGLGYATATRPGTR